MPPRVTLPSLPPAPAAERSVGKAKQRCAGPPSNQAAKLGERTQVRSRTRAPLPARPPPLGRAGRFEGAHSAAQYRVFPLDGGVITSH